MDNKLKDDIYYVCCLIEYIGRATKNRRCDVIRYFDKNELSRQIKIAEVNHCLSFEQVSDETIEELGIKDGEYDTISTCRYNVPSVTSIGRVYQRLIVSVCDGKEIEQTMIDVFSSFISDEISDFNSNVYYSNPDYLKWSYLDGRLLA